MALHPYTLAHIRLSGGAGFRVPSAGRYGSPIRKGSPNPSRLPAGSAAARIPHQPQSNKLRLPSLYERQPRTMQAK